ncbi:helix-hairpin-helix domain-containing protein [Leucobacter sp. HY1908]
MLPEDVLSSERWRSRVGAAGARRTLGAGSRGSASDARAAADTEAFERAPGLSLRIRLVRAVRAPVLAGVAVFVVAVVATIGIAVAGSLGAQLPGERPAPDSTTQALEDAAAQGAFESPASAASSAGSDSSADTSTSVVGEVYVHVVGAVGTPGVVKLRAGARVQDAIDAAGGPTEEAVLAGVNLARVVADGEQLLVPDAEALEAMAAAASAGADAGADAGAGAAGDAGATASASPQGSSGAQGSASLVNINTADAALLETLPRVGPALAGRIIDWRTQNGGFQSVDQLLEVSGIGVKTLEGFRDRVTV